MGPATADSATVRGMLGEAPRLDDVRAEISTIVGALSGRWRLGRGRLTKKRAEVASLLVLSREVVIILDRISRPSAKADKS